MKSKEKIEEENQLIVKAKRESIIHGPRHNYVKQHKLENSYFSSVTSSSTTISSSSSSSTLNGL